MEDMIILFALVVGIFSLVVALAGGGSSGGFIDKTFTRLVAPLQKGGVHAIGYWATPFLIFIFVSWLAGAFFLAAAIIGYRKSRATTDAA